MPITNYDLLIDKELQWGELTTLDGSRIWAFTNPTNVIIPMGFGVVQGEGDEGVKLPDAADNLFEGIAYFTDTLEQREGYTVNTAGFFGYPANYTISVIRRGVVAVPVDQAMSRGNQVFLRHTASAANTAAVAGTFRAAADGTNTIELAHARVYKGCAAPAPNKLATCWIDLRMPN